MSYNYNHLSTGIKGLDKVIKGLMPGDNVVWQVSDVDHYRYFVEAYARFADLRNQRLVYFRFGFHDPLITERNFPDAEIHHLDPSLGFEPFITQIHSIIKKNGRGGYYVFDSMTCLSDRWYSDRMLGNFFMLTCPYLLDMEALAYFSLLRERHSYNALTPIHNTAQIIFDLYKNKENIYIHPLKVQQRYSSTMYMLHVHRDGSYLPVTNSALNSEILSFTPFKSNDHAFEEKDKWNRYFSEAAQYANHGDHENETPAEEAELYLTKLLEMAITRNDKILELAKRYFSIEDLLAIGKRIIGTGLIGGKATGMLLSRAILQKDLPDIKDIIEVHDSFYVGSDVFYTYMVINGCWWIRHQQKDIDSLLSVAEYARRVILTGKFPEDIVKKIADMLDYFGQSPIIVRSSSLLEDNYGNAFSGKYESIFCPNQGSSERRLANLLTAIKTIYASTLSEKALRYREQMGILDKDEQMSLLIQRVSGDLHGNYFFPAVGGVGYSYNPYVWNAEIRPDSGVIRIVYGMGTRAVDRSDDDYTRIAALNAPEKRPESGIDELRKYSQKKIDAIDLDANRLLPVDFSDLSRFSPADELAMAASTDPETGSSFITFDGLFNKTDFIRHMTDILATLEKSYSYPVDIEFTLNFTGNNNYRINLVQCRPFEVRKSDQVDIDFNGKTAAQLIMASRQGTVIGRSRNINPGRIIYVTASGYDGLTVVHKHLAARAIGRIMQTTPEEAQVVLVGPGRWGTTTVALGIPVTFSEISRAACICEVVAMRDGLIPDVSLGTHFFNDLVEFDILYLALYPERNGTIFNERFFKNSPNRFAEILPEEDYQVLRNVIIVTDYPEHDITLKADIISQKYTLVADR
jgi:pyruvate, water dikinase